MFKIGSHVSMSGKQMLVGSVKEALSYNANTFMIYTGAPQNMRRRPIEELNIDAGLKLMQENDINEIVVHAPYIINLGNSQKIETFNLGVDALRQELVRTEALKAAKNIVMHPGAHVGAGDEVGIAQIIKGLNEVLTADTKVNIALETMAGKGSEIGKNFEQLAQIIDGVTYNDKITVCFDTCHLNDAGYDIVNDFDTVLEQFDKIVGINRLAVIHLNDSKNIRGAKKDRHEVLGFGNIGFKALNYIAHHEALTHVPKILETPYVETDDGGSVAPYKYEIAMLRKQEFNDNLIEDIKNQL